MDFLVPRLITGYWTFTCDILVSLPNADHIVPRKEGFVFQDTDYLRVSRGNGMMGIELNQTI
jgi:hypothetical protein